MTTLTRWIPRSLTVIGVVHLLFGLLVRQPNPLVDMAREGFFDTVAGNDTRMIFLWFEVTGVALLALASLASWAARETGRLPRRLGWWLIGMAVPIVVLIPVSGAWLLLAAGIAALVAARGTAR